MHNMLSTNIRFKNNICLQNWSKVKFSHFLYTISFSLILFLNSFPSFADTMDKEDKAQNWYKIEVIIFKYLNFNPEITQYEPIPKVVTHYPDIPFIRVTEDAPLTSNQVSALDIKSLDLYKSYRILSHDRNTRVIYFQGWKQILLENDHATRIRIRSDETPEGYALKGNLFLNKQRFLHAKADLFLLDYEQAYEQSLPEWFYLSDALALPLTQLLIPSSDIDNQQAEPREKIIANMNQSIRLRRDEVHYIDHPAMGLLIEITPTDPPYVPEQNLVAPNTDSASQSHLAPGTEATGDNTSGSTTQNTTTPSTPKKPSASGQ